MDLCSFTNSDYRVLSDALDIAEDVTSDFYKISTAQWRRHPYDIKALSCLKDLKINPRAFAMLTRGGQGQRDSGPRRAKRDFYLIFLQDYQIKKALLRDRQLRLLPLLVYIFTHELVHIIRFSNFLERFDITGQKKEKEEQVVHNITFEILKKLPLPRLDYVLDSYSPYRICEISMS